MRLAILFTFLCFVILTNGQTEAISFSAEASPKNEQITLAKGEGCPDNIDISTSTGILVNSYYQVINFQKDTVYHMTVDTMTVYLSGSSYCQTSLNSITVDGKQLAFVINGYSYNKGYRVLAIPGRYCVNAHSNGGSHAGYFDVFISPVGERENVTIEPSIALYPNPAQDFIVVKSEIIPLSHMEILNSDFKALEEFKFDSEKSVTISLEKYPAGIYFLKVATPNQRTVIRKITIL